MLLNSVGVIFINRCGQFNHLLTMNSAGQVFCLWGNLWRFFFFSVKLLFRATKQKKKAQVISSDSFYILSLICFHQGRSFYLFYSCRHRLFFFFFCISFKQMRFVGVIQSPLFCSSLSFIFLSILSFPLQGRGIFSADWTAVTLALTFSHCAYFF